MAAFGNYPNHIRLFIFSWPSGSGFWDFFKAIKTAEDSQTHQALADFLTALRDNGVLQLYSNIVLHCSFFFRYSSNSYHVS